MIAAVSPAVVVPSLILLKNAGYGINKGVPSLVMAASGIDDVLAISKFGLRKKGNRQTYNSAYRENCGCMKNIFYQNALNSRENRLFFF